jgi:hypothetical protein
MLIIVKAKGIFKFCLKYAQPHLNPLQRRGLQKNRVIKEPSPLERAG